MATTQPKKPTYNSVDEINKIYDKKYQSGKDQLAITQNDTLTGIKNKENQANNTYNSSLLDINKNIQSTQNKYKDIYTGFENKKAEGKADYYNQRDGAMFQNAKNVQSIREYMARNNLSSSGESVDSMLVNNTNFSNTMGGIRNNEQLFLRDIGNQVAQNQRDEQLAYRGYNDDKTKAYNLLNTLLAGYLDERNNAKKNYNLGLSSLLSGNDSDRAKAIYDYNQIIEQAARTKAEAEAQRSWEQKQTEAQRLWEQAQDKAERDWKTAEAEKDRALSRESIYASRSSGGSSSANEGWTADMENSLFNAYDTATTPTGLATAMDDIENAYDIGLITKTQRNAYLNDYQERIALTQQPTATKPTVSTKKPFKEMAY